MYTPLHYSFTCQFNNDFTNYIKVTFMTTNVKTIFVSGLSLRASVEDNIAILGLIDAFSDEENPTKYSFAIPKSVCIELQNGLNNLLLDFQDEEKVEE